MEFTVAPGDQLIVWWPNGAGYDLFEIKHGLNATEFVLVGEFAVTGTGKYVKINGKKT